MGSSVTNVTKPLSRDEFPQMSYTGVTTNRDMANSFVTNLLKVAHKMVPDREWNLDDLISVLKTALENDDRKVALLEGRYLRKNLRDQMARTERYGEHFTLVVLLLEFQENDHVYQSIVDALFERLRRSDKVFLYRRRIAIILPHTDSEGAHMLISRLNDLMKKFIGGSALPELRSKSFPTDDIESQDDFLDWAEEQLR